MFIQILSALCAITLISCTKAYDESDLLGIWKGKHKDKLVEFNFYNNGECRLIIIDSTIDSKYEILGNCEINFSKKPAILSIRNIANFDRPLHTIIEFIEKDSIRIAPFSTRWRLRPVAFDVKDSMRLKRIGTNNNG